jgi:hypothetical protein
MSIEKFTRDCRIKASLKLTLDIKSEIYCKNNGITYIAWRFVSKNLREKKWDERFNGAQWVQIGLGVRQLVPLPADAITLNSIAVI